MLAEYNFNDVALFYKYYEALAKKRKDFEYENAVGKTSNHKKVF